MDTQKSLSRKILVVALTAAGLMAVAAPGVAEVQVAHGYAMGAGMMGGYGPGFGMVPGASGAPGPGPGPGAGSGYENRGPGYSMGRGMTGALGMSRGMMGGYGPGAGMGPGTTQGSETGPGLTNYLLDLFDELRAMRRAIQQAPKLKK